MKALLDTHIILWALTEDKKLPQRARLILSQKENEIGYQMLAIQDKHVHVLEELQRMENVPAHKDPFDRIMIAQAKAENMTFVTHDSLLLGYREECVAVV